MAAKERFEIDRRPWLLAAVAVIALLVVVLWCWFWPPKVTTVYIVRHAEKAAVGGDDPPLSAAGQARAEELAHVLADEGLDAVFVSNFLRTQQTGAPAATAAGVAPEEYPAADTRALVDTILGDHAGERILVVGHSNTVDDIAARLGASGLSDLAENQYDRLFVVHRVSGIAHLDRLRYGAETP